MLKKELRMKVLLVNAFQSPSVSAGFYHRFLAPMPPISLAYPAAALERAGIDVEVYDDALNRGDPARLAEAIRSSRPDIVGLSAVTATMPGVERVARTVRSVSPSSKIVMGNVHADVFYESILKAGLADIVVRGEGEVTFVDLVDELSQPSPDLESILGISFLDAGEVITTGARPYIQDLDSLPFPAWHLFPIRKYRIFNFARVREPAALLLGSRGCPFRCNYCSLKIMGHVRRARSAGNIADEFEYLHDRFGYRQISFTDPIFPFNQREGLAVAAELIRRGLHRKLVWITETRTDLVDLELLQALREAGLQRIMFGFETGNQSQLKTLEKGGSIERGFRAVRAARKAGLQTVGFFMIGIPGSTPQSLQATIDYSIALDLDFAKFAVFVPFPGTPIHTELLENGEIEESDNWNRYTNFPTTSCPPGYVPKGLTAQDIIRCQRRAYTSFYLRTHMVMRQLFKIRTLTLQDAFNGLQTMMELAKASQFFQHHARGNP
jgi:anaerobic magnesium-protoporphyrin IX monomethyl ester cyclase